MLLTILQIWVINVLSSVTRVIAHTLILAILEPPMAWTRSVPSLSNVGHTDDLKTKYERWDEDDNVEYSKT